MKKLKKLLRASKRAPKKAKVTYTKWVAAFKKYFQERKKDNFYRKQLAAGLLALGASKKVQDATPEDNVKGGLYLFETYRDGYEDSVKHSRPAALKMALYKTAVAISNEDQYDRALKVALTRIPEPKSPTSEPVKPVWKWIIFGICVLAALGLVALFSSSKKVTITNDTPPETVPDNSVCQTWVMEAAPFETKDNKLYVEGLKVVQEAKLGKSSENNEKALEALQMYRNKKIYLLDIAQSELSPEAWAKVDQNAISDTDSCANEATNKLYQDVIFEVMHSDVSIENLPSPSTWYNSGLSKGKIVVDGQKGITGNVKAIVVRHRDGRVTAYLARCGNPVHKDQKGHDKGDTDEHHHHPTPPPPPPNSKSSNPNDYQRPGTDNTRDSGRGTKPRVSETRPADANPPVVPTAKVGGGGVVDTPTNRPGSETGVTAPAAKPAPTTPPAPKPNEGGTNNGVVTD